MASSNLSSIFSNKGTYRTPTKQFITSNYMRTGKKLFWREGRTCRVQSNWIISKPMTKMYPYFHKTVQSCPNQTFWHSASLQHTVWFSFENWWKLNQSTEINKQYFPTFNHSDMHKLPKLHNNGKHSNVFLKKMEHVFINFLFFIFLCHIPYPHPTPCTNAN